MKSDVFFGVVSSKFCDKRRFGGIYRLHLQNRENPRERNSLRSRLAESNSAIIR
jgi:hypothetical protein